MIIVNNNKNIVNFKYKLKNCCREKKVINTLS